MAAKAEAERANAEEEPELVPFTSRDVSKYKAGDRFVKPAFGGEPAFSGTIRRISGMDSKIWVEPDDNEQKLAA